MKRRQSKERTNSTTARKENLNGDKLPCKDNIQERSTASTPDDDNWNLQFKRLLQCSHENGQACATAAYKKFGLGVWMLEQKALARKGMLDSGRAKQLEDLGIDFSSSNTSPEPEKLKLNITPLDVGKVATLTSSSNQQTPQPILDSGKDKQPEDLEVDISSSKTSPETEKLTTMDTPSNLGKAVNPTIHQQPGKAKQLEDLAATLASSSNQKTPQPILDSGKDKQPEDLEVDNSSSKTSPETEKLTTMDTPSDLGKAVNPTIHQQSGKAKQLEDLAATLASSSNQKTPQPILDSGKGKQPEDLEVDISSSKTSPETEKWTTLVTPSDLGKAVNPTIHLQPGKAKQLEDLAATLASSSNQKTPQPILDSGKDKQPEDLEVDISSSKTSPETEKLTTLVTPSDLGKAVNPTIHQQSGRAKQLEDLGINISSSNTSPETEKLILTVTPLDVGKVVDPTSCSQQKVHHPMLASGRSKQLEDLGINFSSSNTSQETEKFTSNISTLDSGKAADPTTSSHEQTRNPSLYEQATFSPLKSKTSMVIKPIDSSLRQASSHSYDRNQPYYGAAVKGGEDAARKKLPIGPNSRVIQSERSRSHSYSKKQERRPIFPPGAEGIYPKKKAKPNDEPFVCYIDTSIRPRRKKRLRRSAATPRLLHPNFFAPDLPS